MLDGVYCTRAEGAPANSQFHPAPALTREKLEALLDKIITRILRLLTREGHLVGEEDRAHCDVTAGIHLPAGRQVQRLAALVPRPRLHLIRFRALAPNAQTARRDSADSPCAHDNRTFGRVRACAWRAGTYDVGSVVKARFRP